MCSVVAIDVILLLEKMDSMKSMRHIGRNNFHLNAIFFRKFQQVFGTPSRFAGFVAVARIQFYHSLIYLKPQQKKNFIYYFIIGECV